MTPPTVTVTLNLRLAVHSLFMLTKFRRGRRRKHISPAAVQSLRSGVLAQMLTSNDYCILAYFIAVA
jgi:hypothetical protein